MTTDPDKVNPNWVRPSDWNFEEDWNSPAWRRRMESMEKKAREKRDKHGFLVCPNCNTGHTNKTLCCRECKYMKRFEVRYWVRKDSDGGVRECKEIFVCLEDAREFQPTGDIEAIDGIFETTQRMVDRKEIPT